MLFNSLIYLYLFLPITFAGYFIVFRFFSDTARVVWLVSASVFFYGFWNPIYIPLLLGSAVWNFLLGNELSNGTKEKTGFGLSKKNILIVGIVSNLGLLGFFKYADFFITNVNWLLGYEIPLANIALPLAISFFTFQQIAYLVDSYRNITEEHSITHYILFVTFFPQLIAGPIVHHKEMLPQFEDQKNSLINYRNICLGLFILFMGLVKKVGIADSFAVWANAGYWHEGTLTFFDAWATSLSYTMQLYFDFSGYTDMAIGSALLFNIKLPINFNSPYKATNIQDFWNRWHITMTNWFKDYLYMPLTWSWRRLGGLGINLSLLVTFVIIGLWHGGAWTFIMLGALHGIALVTYRLWRKYVKWKMPTILGWFLTFNFINVAWVFFRAPSFEKIQALLSSMFGLNGVGLQTELFSFMEPHVLTRISLTLPEVLEREVVVWLLAALAVVVMFKNSNELREQFKPSLLYAGITIVLFVLGIWSLGGFSEFLYFNF